ncbi:MAG: hypothetical protein AB7L18_15010 [Hyphomicrobiaceae bacterium]
MSMLKPGATTDDWEFVCHGAEGLRARIYSPIVGSICGRCESRADDVCFLIDGQDGSKGGGGLCGPCLVAVLHEYAADRG